MCNKPWQFHVATARNLNCTSSMYAFYQTTQNQQTLPIPVQVRIELLASSFSSPWASRKMLISKKGEITFSGNRSPLPACPFVPVEGIHPCVLPFACADPSPPLGRMENHVWPRTCMSHWIRAAQRLTGHRSVKIKRWMCFDHKLARKIIMWTASQKVYSVKIDCICFTLKIES